MNQALSHCDRNYELFGRQQCLANMLITIVMFCTSSLQLIGIPVPGLEPEFQPVANYLLPHIMSHKQDAVDMHLQVN